MKILIELTDGRKVEDHRKIFMYDSRKKAYLFTNNFEENTENTLVLKQKNVVGITIEDESITPEPC